eukprot:GHVQ01008908.1.p1 GENE.GHVQ01008908.1~~GHVQ01008908.1.p1  ORF type:complete len:190 (+),score=22.43 GHVQ01008908.1:35-604(+)
MAVDAVRDVAASLKLLFIQLSDTGVFDFVNLRSCYQQSVLLAFAGLSYEIVGGDPCGRRQLNVLVLGLGGGILPSSITSFYSRDEVMVTSVELDPDVVQLAENHFGYKVSDNNSCLIGDGLVYVSTLNDTQHQDIIIVDVSSGSSACAISCPTPEFVTPEALSLFHSKLSTGGLLVFNLLTRCSDVRAT